MSSNYWSSTTNANNTNNAWHVNFNNGNVNNNNKSNSYYVRAVRAGKCELLSFASVYRAYLDCRKRKRGTVNALRFEYDLLENLMRLAMDIQQGTYRPSPSVCFVTTRPKLREIFAADFRDRIVHHLVVRELEKAWESKFIYDSFASRKGKGTHAAVKRLQGFMQKATRSMKRPAWYLQLDIRSFFMSIDRNILFTILDDHAGRRMEETTGCGLLYLLHRIIFHDCTAEFRFKGNASMLGKVPPHKSLFANAPGKGLPIGNLTSQFLSNVYLNELDQFVKHRLKCRFYIRYVDDFVLVATSREKLLGWRDDIEGFLAERLCLRLKDSGKLRRVSDGADFLGYIVRPRYILARRRVVNNLKARLERYRRHLVTRGDVDGRRYVRFLMAPEMVKALRQTVSSYLGHLKHAATFRLLKSLWAGHAWLGEYFTLHGGKLCDRYKYRGVFRSLRAQVCFFRKRLGDEAVVFVKVGKFYELFDDDARTVGAKLGLRPLPVRKGLACVAGFPARMRGLYVRKAIRAGFGVVVVEQKGVGQFVAERYVHEICRLGGHHA